MRRVWEGPLAVHRHDINNCDYCPETQKIDVDPIETAHSRMIGPFLGLPSITTQTLSRAHICDRKAGDDPRGGKPADYPLGCHTVDWLIPGDWIRRERSTQTLYPYSTGVYLFFGKSGIFPGMHTGLFPYFPLAIFVDVDRFYRYPRA